MCPRGAPAGDLDRKILLGNAICVGSDTGKQRMKAITHLPPPAIKSLRMPTVFDNPSTDIPATAQSSFGHAYCAPIFVYALTLA